MGKVRVFCDCGTELFQEATHLRNSATVRHIESLAVCSDCLLAREKAVQEALSVTAGPLRQSRKQLTKKNPRVSNANSTTSKRKNSKASKQPAPSKANTAAKEKQQAD